VTKVRISFGWPLISYYIVTILPVEEGIDQVMVNPVPPGEFTSRVNRFPWESGDEGFILMET
jgi:hypothetical protein